MTKYHNIEEETAANLDEWRSTITNDTKFEQFTASLPDADSYQPLRLIYYNNQYGLFCERNYYYTSTDLKNWTKRQLSNPYTYDVFTTSKAAFVNSGSKLLASTDLTTWYECSSYTYSHHVCDMSHTTTAHKICSIYNTDKQIRIYTLATTFSNNWSVSSSNSNYFRTKTGETTDIIWAGDRYFFANIGSPYCFYSKDGSNWFEVELPFTVDGINYSIMNIAGTTGKYYIILNDANNVYYTPDFKTWNKITINGGLSGYRPIMFYHETLKEMVGIHGRKDLWFQEDIPNKFSLVGPKRNTEIEDAYWDAVIYNGEKYIAWDANKSSGTLYFATISDAYKDSNLSYVLSMLIQKMDETNTKLQTLINLQQ